MLRLEIFRITYVDKKKDHVTCMNFLFPFSSLHLTKSSSFFSKVQIYIHTTYQGTTHRSVRVTVTDTFTLISWNPTPIWHATPSRLAWQTAFLKIYFTKYMVLYYNNASKMIIQYTICHMSYAKPCVNWIEHKKDIWGDRACGAWPTLCGALILSTKYIYL